MFYGLSAQELQHIVRKPKPKESQESQESQKPEVSAIATAKKPEWRKKNINYQSEKTIHQQ